MEKYKKANELDKILQIEEKLEKIPLRGFVASPLCKQKILLGVPERYLVAKNDAFETLENLSDSARRMCL